MICEGCKQPIPETVWPAQCALLPHRRKGEIADEKWQVPVLPALLADVSLFCSVRCMRDWCDRIMNELGYA